MLYTYFATPAGLEEWFADKVNSRSKLITFIWDGVEEQAKILVNKSNERIKYKWLESGDDETYFEFRVEVDAITKDVSLMVTDFADTEEDIEESKMLWENQIEELKHTIGA
jgi:uncharacterized protein YndB with AHSA1/START domain